MLNLAIILYTTVLGFMALYAPQPLLPLLAREFGVSAADAQLLITAALLPLGLAPVLYGSVLERVPARSLLRGAVALLAVTEVLFALATEFWMLVAVRLMQGLLLPAIFTALMTYLSITTRAERMRSVLGIYVAATIVGGLSGRLLAGLIASQGDWQHTFVLLAAGLAVAALALLRLEVDARPQFSRIRPAAVLEVLTHGEVRKALAVIFLIFCVFASLLNMMPFRLTVLNAGLNEFDIALVYSGYLIGVVVALTAGPLTQRCGGEVRTLLFGAALYLAALAMFAVPSLGMAYAAMWVFCAGMFLIHALLSAYLNQRAAERKGLVNGLYISSYYLGGTVGSLLPGYLYRSHGWTPYLILLATLVVLAAVIAARLRPLPTQ